MSEVKQIFTSGKMNKDLDERIIPNGEYRDALNLNSTASDGENVGSLQNLLGNEIISDITSGLSNPITIGSISYKRRNKLYWLVTSNTLDGIYEYDKNTGNTTPILIEKRSNNVLNTEPISISSDENYNLLMTGFVVKDLNTITGNTIDTSVTGAQTIINNSISISNDRHGINIDIPKGTIIEYTKDKDLLFYDIEYTGKNISNIVFTVNYASGDILNFNSDKTITGINIIDDMLFWTDNYNQPRKININKFKKYTNGDSSKTTKIEGKDFTERHISVAKLSPLSAPNLDLKSDAVDGISTVSNIEYDFKSPVEKFASGNAAATDIQLDNLPLDISWKKNDSIKAIPIGVPQTNLTANVSEAPEVNFKVISVDKLGILGSATSSTVILRITSIENNDQSGGFIFEFSSQEGKALYELKFPTFSYRWKYKDNEYSVFAPFSEAAFLPGTFYYNTETGYNAAMENKVKRIVLNNIEIGNEDVDEIDIIYKDSRNSNVYTIDTVKRKNELGTIFNGSYIISKEKIDAVIESNQLLRQWDNVPRKALAQEITGNRVVYGNYLQNFNIPITTKLDLGLVNNSGNIPNASIKSNRTYQVGVVYIDEFNRQSPVQTGIADFDGGTVLDVSGKHSKNVNAISAKITSPTPAWATHFKYFIKETSMEYYNLALDNIYQERNDTGFVWLSFSSNDINKIRPDKLVEDFIVLKKEHNSNTPVDFSEDARFKVLDIQRDPPEFLSEEYNLKTTLSAIKFAEGPPPPMGSKVNRNYTNVVTRATINGSPVAGGTQIAIRGSDGDTGVPVANWKSAVTGEILIKAGMYIEFYIPAVTGSNEVSNKYRIKQVSIESSSDDEIGIEIEGGFGDDVDFCYVNNKINNDVLVASNGTSGVSSNGVTGVAMRVFEKQVTKNYDAKFSGRFFVKIENKPTVETHLVEAGIMGSKTGGYLTAKSIKLFGEDQSKTDKNCKKSKKKGGDEQRKRSSWFIKDGGRKGAPSINFQGANYHFHVIGSTCIADMSGFPSLKPGDRLKFSNQNRTVYEITRVHQASERYSYNSGFSPTKSWVKLPQVYFAVKIVSDFDQTTGASTNLSGDILKEDVLIPGSNSEVYVQKLKLDATEFDFKSTNPAIFETEPRESASELDIYYETQDAYSIDQAGKEQVLRWYNCFNFNGIESNRIRDDYNAPTIAKGVRVSATLAEKYKEERVFNGLIHSGIINSKNSVNRSNEFIQAEAITKNLLPSYGSIQKLHARDNDIVVFCENKVLKIMSDKDILYNADGSGNVRASRTPLGSTIPYQGEFGIGENPESFASFGYRVYFVDRPRGNVLRLSGDGIERISRYGLTDFWKNNLSTHSRFIGSYDEVNNLYNLSIPCLYTTCFDDAVNGWTTRKSWVSESALSLNNNFYTYKNGELWRHESSVAPRNNFYGEQYLSSLQCTLNEEPSIIKRFKTIGYEGSSDWQAKMVTDQNVSSLISFTDKENKYFSYVKGEEKNENNLNEKNFSVQGLGESLGVILDSSTSASNTTQNIVVNLKPKQTPGINCGEALFSGAGTSSQTQTIKVDKNDLDKQYCIDLVAKQGYSFDKSNMGSSLGVFLGGTTSRKLCFTGRELLKAKDDNKDPDSGFKTNKSITIPELESIDGTGIPDSNNIPSDVNIFYDSGTSETEYTVSGTSASSMTNATIDSSGSSYTVTSTKNTQAYIQTRTITPNSGYVVNLDSITVNNTRIVLEKTLNGDGSATIKEYVIVKEIDESGVDYTVSFSSTTAPVVISSINNFYAQPISIPGSGGRVKMTVSGASGSSGKIIITNASGTQITTPIPFKI